MFDSAERIEGREIRYAAFVLASTNNITSPKSECKDAVHSRS